jgi:MFS family permease
MAYVADRTDIEERGRVSGLTILEFSILMIPPLIIIDFLKFEPVDFAHARTQFFLIIALVRSTSLLIFGINKLEVKNKISTALSMPKANYKALFYYVIPWLMFILAATIANNFIPQNEFQSAYETGNLLRFLNIAIFGFFIGFVADRFGRRFSIIFGLGAFTLSFFILGFFGFTDTNVILFYAISGVGWGIFFTIYLTIPGDLSMCGEREKFYSILIVLPLLLMMALQELLVFDDSFLKSTEWSQFLGYILIISMIVIWYAKETLPEKKIYERRMKIYMNKVRKIVSDSEKE